MLDMNYNKACEILSIPKDATPATIKRMYYKKALKLHPDKQGNTEQFQELNDAYMFLQKQPEPNFIEILRNSSILKILDTLDDGTLLSLYKFLLDYSEYIPVSVFDTVINYIKTKLTILILEPTIDDLLNQRIYIHTHENKKYSIPLWHHELVYDTFMVICKPKVDIEMDSENNIYVDAHASLQDIFLKGTLSIFIGKMQFNIDVTQLYLKPIQIFTVSSTIPKINNNIYSDTFSLIYVQIFLK